VIKLGECELDYPTITRFKVWVGKVYMGEYDKAEMVRKFGDKWLDRANENGVRWVEIYLYKSFSKRY
jgi:hypothetical protein